MVSSSFVDGITRLLSCSPITGLIDAVVNTILYDNGNVILTPQRDVPIELSQRGDGRPTAPRRRGG